MATLQNIGKLKYRGKDGQWHPLPVVVQDADGGVSTISGKGAPTSATQGKVNQLYRDEDTQKLYICTATDGGYTWAAVSGGSVDVDATLTQSGQAADAKASGDAIGRKIDAPQTAQVGEVLTVEEVDAEGKPKKWKTAPGTDITTELSEESTDEQVPSAKATYNAVHDAKWTTDFYINITKTTINGDSTYIADKTFAEIKEAYYSNMTVYAILFYGYNGYGYMIPASYYFDGSVNSTDNSCIYFNRVVDLKEIFNISIDINDNVIVESSETGISSHSWNDVPKVLQQSPNAISVSGAGAPDGGGLLFYNQGKRDKVISYNMISNSGRYYIVSYDRQYNTVGTYLAGTFAPAVTADDNGKILRVENGLWKPRENTSLPTPTTAQVGQIVKVKAVDADGKITETEAVDMPNRLDVTVSVGDNGWVVSHKFAEVKAAYDAGRAVQLINVSSNSSILYSLEYISTDNNGVSSANFRYIDIGGDIWQAEINSNDEIEFFQGSTFLALYGDIPQDTPKAITYSVANGIGYADVMLREDTALILKSSTEGSTKKFKITVDDSGTMSATEITN